jgi:hypothetical protein
MAPIYKELCLKTSDIARSAGKFMAEERKNFDASKIEIMPMRRVRLFR